MAESTGRSGDITLAEARGISNLVNAATGRGKLGRLEPIGDIAGDFAFAPRYYASRIQMLVGEPLWTAPTSRVRVAVAKEYARYVVGFATLQMLLSLTDGELEGDPRSTDFGKARWDNVRLGYLSGFQQFITFASRLLTGETKNSRGEVVPIRGEDVPYGGTTTADVAFRFLRSKASPGMSVVVDLMTGEDFMGRDMTPARLASHFAGPITYRDIYQVMHSEMGVPQKVALSMLAMLGASVNTYQQPENGRNR